MRIPFLSSSRREFVLEPLTMESAGALASEHEEDFVRPWTEAEFAALLGHDTVFGFAAREVGKPQGRILGFSLARLAAGAGEILSVVTARSHRRPGIRRLLMEPVLPELHR